MDKKNVMDAPPDDIQTSDTDELYEELLNTLDEKEQSRNIDNNATDKTLNTAQPSTVSKFMSSSNSVATENKYNPDKKFTELLELIHEENTLKSIEINLNEHEHDAKTTPNNVVPESLKVNLSNDKKETGVKAQSEVSDRVVPKDNPVIAEDDRSTETESENASKSDDFSSSANKIHEIAEIIKEIDSGKSDSDKSTGSEEEDIQSTEPEVREKADLDLLLALGMADNEDYDKMFEARKSAQVKRKAAAEIREREKSQTGYVANEYINIQQNNKIFNKYKKLFSYSFVRLIICSFLFVIGMYIETAPYYGLPIPDLLNVSIYGIIYILFDIQILLVAVFLVGRSMIEGIKSIIKLTPNIYSISVLFVTFTLIQSIAVYYSRYNIENIKLYNSISVLAMAFLCLYEFLDLKKEIWGFKAVSSKNVKTALLTLKKGSTENIEFGEYLPDDVDMYRSGRTGFIGGFFTNTYKNKHNINYLKLMLPVIALISIITFIFLIAFKKGLLLSLSSLIIIVISSLPVCLYFGMIYPSYKAQKNARTFGGALIGSAGIDEYSDIGILSLDDKDVFPARLLKITGIKVYGENNINDVIKYLSLIFDKFNGSLTEVFNASAAFPKNFIKHVDYVDISENGIYAMFKDKKLFAGKTDYITNMGFSPSDDLEYDNSFEKSFGSIMYLADEDEIMAKLYLKYEVSPNFLDIVKKMTKAGICLGIRTMDPNINNDLLSKVIPLKKYPVKIIKSSSVDEAPLLHEKIDSGIVAKNSIGALVSTVLLCANLKYLVKGNMVVHFAAYIIGIIMSLFITIFGSINDIHAIHIAVYQLFWMLPILFLTNVSQK